MQKILWLILSLMMIAEARENPFKTTMSPESVGQTTEIPESRKDFVSATLKLPSSARILKSASAQFQNIDGSISEEVVAIDQNVDWHYPLILSSQLAEKSKIVTSLTTTVVPTKMIETSKSNNSKSKEHSAKNTFTAESSFQLTNTLSLVPNGNEMTVFTKDSKMRDFLIADPYKVVVDFKKNSSFATKTLMFPHSPFVSVTLGDHDGFYRIAILLDGHYRYDISPFNGGYIIKLK